MTMGDRVAVISRGDCSSSAPDEIYSDREIRSLRVRWQPADEPNRG